MKLNEIQNLANKEIVLVSGNLCSGKGTFCQNKYPDYQQITVSSIVKRISGFNTRSELGTTKSLDMQIAERLIDAIRESHSDKIIVDGIRQIKILEMLKSYFKGQIKDIIWLDVPTEELKNRFTKRAAGKDDMNFEQSMQSDKDLGIGEVEDYIRANHSTVKNS